MKVGILVPEGQDHDGLIEGLKSAGVDVAVHVTHSPEAPVLLPARAGALLETASDRDLIHNLAGSLGLLCANLCGKPMLTSLTGLHTEEDVAIFKASRADSFFVSEQGHVPPAGLKAVPGVSICTGDRVSFYLDAYSRLLALGKRKEHRPWGSYEVLSDDCHDHKVKRITVLPGKRLSLQYHGRRREHWIIVSGDALVTVGHDMLRLTATQAIDIPHGEAHRVENVGELDLVFIEVQQGDYFGEDDIVRIEDDFGRL
ncbi:MAG TPA: phosphomannose isomerase type II C-terminal cupin domain [Deltaproteobacteria bacterium]|nr:phosphomannose isomerase type II C-terminal cupin domain [Deltaproteobacteria bacterium]